MNATLQQHIVKITVNRILDLIHIINSLNECLFCAIQTEKKFPQIRERTLFNDKLGALVKVSEYNRQIAIKREESLEKELTSLQFYLKSNKTDINDIVLPLIENIISVEDVTSRCKEIEKLNRKLKECIADFREGNIVLSVIAEKIEL